MIFFAGSFTNEYLLVKTIGAVMTTMLRDVALTRAGYPFRGSVPEQPEGTVMVVQIRDINRRGDIAWNSVARTTLPGRKAPGWLRSGDIIFIARTDNNQAVCIQDVPGEAVCSQYFFVIHVRDITTLLPAFLAWQINQYPAQQYLRKNAEGTGQLSIRRGVLDDLPVVVPPMAVQVTTVKMANALYREQQLLQNLADNRERQIDALAVQLFAAGTL